MRTHAKRVEEYARILCTADGRSAAWWPDYRDRAELVIKQADCEILAGAHDSGFLKSIMEKYDVAQHE